MTDDRSPAAPRKRSRWKLGCTVVMLSLVALICVAGVVIYGLWNAEPTQWKAIAEFKRSVAVQERVKMADNVRNRFLREISALDDESDQVVGDEGAASQGANATARDASTSHAPSAAKPRERVISMTTDELNAWLDQGLPSLLVNQEIHLPDELSNLAAWGENGKPVFAFKVATPQVQQVVSIVLNPEFLPTGKARASIAAVRGGKLPLPLKTVTGLVRDKLEAADRKDLVDRLQGAVDGKEFDPTGSVDGTRTARLVGLKFNDTGLDLTFRIEKKDKRPQAAAKTPSSATEKETP